MIPEKLANIRVWHFDQLKRYRQILHFVTDRHGGISKDPYFSLNLSFKVNDNVNSVTKNRELLAGNLKLNPEQFLYPDQCHTSNVKLVKSINQEKLAETDALITNVPGIFICVTTADCVPIILYDPVKHSIGVVHAGWRGLVGSIIIKTIDKMIENFETDPKNLLACIGPSISSKNYQVGNEVINEVVKLTRYKKGFIYNEDKSGRGYLDLQEFSRFQLINVGLDYHKIEIAGICTYDNNNDFYSARKEGFETGRFASGIMLNFF